KCNMDTRYDPPSRRTRGTDGRTPLVRTRQLRDAIPKRGGLVKLWSKTHGALTAFTAAALSLVLVSTALPGICPEADAPEPGANPAPVHGLNPADMNPSVSACTDFNQYGNGGWLKANPIPPDQSYWGSFTILDETNRANLRKVLEKAAADTTAAPGSDQKKIGDFWASCMDEAAIESAGLTPLKPELARI